MYLKDYYVTRTVSSPIKVSTGISNALSFNIYTIFNDLTNVRINFGDETYEDLNIAGIEKKHFIFFDFLTFLSFIS